MLSQDIAQDTARTCPICLEAKPSYISHPPSERNQASSGSVFVLNANDARLSEDKFHIICRSCLDRMPKMECPICRTQLTEERPNLLPAHAPVPAQIAAPAQDLPDHPVQVYAQLYSVAASRLGSLARACIPHMRGNGR